MYITIRGKVLQVPFSFEVGKPERVNTLMIKIEEPVNQGKLIIDLQLSSTYIYIS